MRQRGEDLKYLSEDEYQKLMIFFANLIQAIGQESQVPSTKMRMQVIATAVVYFKRFYARRSFKDIDPFLLAPTCICLASKVEEFGMMSTSKLNQTMLQALKRFQGISQELLNQIAGRLSQVQEAEFFLLEMMDCCLIVYHPYRPLVQFLAELSSGSKDSKDTKDNELSSMSWKICNDTLRTDVSLMYPPFQIALACIMIASIWCNRDLKGWFVELAVDMEKVLEIQQYILNMYRLWKTFDEKEQLPGLLAKIPKPQPNP